MIAVHIFLLLFSIFYDIQKSSVCFLHICCLTLSFCTKSSKKVCCTIATLTRTLVHGSSHLDSVHMISKSLECSCHRLRQMSFAAGLPWSHESSEKPRHSGKLDPSLHHLQDIDINNLELNNNVISKVS